ncbi:MAG TPA: M3 family oligoendopeptidase [Geminicoccus sp.]|uniref:M3 family oligoendopeptidase n=1 Tax=Geminicoccus sp. TaxID=2024832 RepID=UPI002E36D9CA|nr:M3 family oligoendopeptidase [Geminicoccus sp.]HEX2528328.1 M3 family oligoendopeptidase [Geminicoccus sp.]
MLSTRLDWIRDTETSAAAGLPREQQGPAWDLTDLYPSRTDPQIQADLAACKAEAERIAKSWQGRVATLSGDELAELIEAYEALDDRLGRLAAFAQLLFAADRDDAEIGRFYQGVQEQITAVSSTTLFVTLEINKVEQADLDAKLDASPRVARFRPWLRDTRAWREHQLEDAVEKVLLEKYVTGRSAWVRLFDETMAGLRFPFEGKDLTSQEIFDKLSSKDRGVREAAATSIGAVLAKNQKLFARITNTLAKDKQIEDGWRKFPRPISARNLSNQVEDEVVDALISAVQSTYPKLSHRYYALKAKWLGLEQLEYWDRNAPLPEESDTRLPWNRAMGLVVDAYGRFSPKLAGIVQDFFERNWIDAELRPGKDSGAFCHPTTTSAHPYVLMNYQGRTRDVMTLAHELGHGVHQVLAAKHGPLMASTPLTLAETASVFGEQLTFRSLLDATQDRSERRVLLASKIEDMLNTVVRQIAFVEFERRVHDARKTSELTPTEICKIWMDVQTESLGPAFRFRQDYETFWSYIPHFIHSPFYVYAYAFGDCLVNSLYAVYEQNPDGFEPKYLELLAAGGTLRHKELLAPFGLDATDPDFWTKGLGVLERFIDELATELKEAGIADEHTA